MAGLQDLLSRCEETLAALWPTLRNLAAAVAAAEASTSRAREAARQAEEREPLARIAQEEARAAATLRDVLEEGQGPASGGRPNPGGLLGA